MTYNDNLILRYLYGLDEKRDYPQSIKRFLMDVGSEIDEDRESAINELYGLKNNCKKLAVLSKKFVDAMDKSYMKFTQFHMYNPQIEMFAHFKTKSSFHKTKCII